MNKKLVSILLAAMLSAEPCSMVYAEDFAENISVENDVEVTEEAEQEPEETQPEQDIADNEDSEEIADIEEPETKEEEIFLVKMRLRRRSLGQQALDIVKMRVLMMSALFLNRKKRTMIWGFIVQI